MTEWDRGLQWIPGLRIIPQSRNYTVTLDTVDAVVETTHHTIPCSLVSKFTQDELGCFDWSAMGLQLTKRLTAQYPALRVTRIGVASHVAPALQRYLEGVYVAFADQPVPMQFRGIYYGINDSVPHNGYCTL